MKRRSFARPPLACGVPWLAAGWMAALALALAPSCRRQEPAPSAAAASTSAAATIRPRPIDRLAPGELEPGTEDAFGLVLPRQVQVARRFGDTVYAEGRVKPEELANYVRDRVVVSHVELGTARTVFPRATLRGGDPNRIFRIEVISARGRTELVVRDVTPVPAPPGLTEEERWRSSGTTMDGEIVDPKLD